jgi:hypothetical protein
LIQTKRFQSKRFLRKSLAFPKPRARASDVFWSHVTKTSLALALALALGLLRKHPITEKSQHNVASAAVCDWI